MHLLSRKHLLCHTDLGGDLEVQLTVVGTGLNWLGSQNSKGFNHKVRK